MSERKKAPQVNTSRTHIAIQYEVPLVFQQARSAELLMAYDNGGSRRLSLLSQVLVNRTQAPVNLR